MADYTISPSAVKYVSGPLRFGLAASAINAGQAVWKNLSISNEEADSVRLADANTGTDANDMVNGVAMNSAAQGQTVGFLTDDGSGTSVFEVTGAAFTPGDTIILSGNAGGLAPDADLASGWMKNYVGVFKTATQIKVSINNTGIRKT